MKAQSLNEKGKIAEVEIESKLFDLKTNKKLLAKYVRVYLSRQRSANAETKDRGEVHGGGRKPWKQKGTGRARSGSIRSPLWKGGGVVFGPENVKNYKLKINKKESVIAFITALKIRSEEKTLFTATFPKFKKTKEANAYFENAKLEGKVTVISDDIDLYRCLKGVESFKVKNSKDLSTYDLLNAKTVVFADSVLPELLKIKENIYSNKS